MNVPPEEYAWKAVGFNGQPAVNVGPVCPACAWMLHEQDLLIDGALTQEAIDYYHSGRKR